MFLYNYVIILLSGLNLAVLISLIAVVSYKIIKIEKNQIVGSVCSLFEIRCILMHLHSVYKTVILTLNSWSASMPCVIIKCTLMEKDTT